MVSVLTFFPGGEGRRIRRTALVVWGKHLISEEFPRHSKNFQIEFLNGIKTIPRTELGCKSSPCEFFGALGT